MAVQPLHPTPSTLIHITHEGGEQLGGIGTVLQGLITSKAVKAAVKRNILVGPLPYADAQVAKPIERLGEFATECLYSGPDGYDPQGYGAILKPIEWAMGTPIVYGRRYFAAPGAEDDTAHHTSAELLLFDLNAPNSARLSELKFMLFDKFGLDSHKFEHGWDYEEWVRLAAPAYHTLCALLGEVTSPADRAMVIGHEFMGMATALRCSLDASRFVTAFHAHECSTARRIVEGLPGNDVAFYPAMRLAASHGQYVTDVFGDQSAWPRQALIGQSHRLSTVLAVGQETAEELKFLSPAMKNGPVRICYNAVPSAKVDWAGKKQSRSEMDAFLLATTGRTYDYIITHVTRPVPSKGLWRDAMLLDALEPLLKAAGKTAAYVLLTCGAPVRTKAQADAMFASHRWPGTHHIGGSDLQGPELELFNALPGFAHSQEPGFAGAVRHVLVNQFGWSRQRLGDACPAEMTFDDLRRCADVELGLSTYEPFGISPLEPLHAGAICVVSTVSGCMGLVNRTISQRGQDHSRLIVAADFTHEDDAKDVTPASLIAMTSAHRREVELAVCNKLAKELFARLPVSDTDRQALLAEGQRLANAMSWDAIAASDFLPGISVG